MRKPGRPRGSKAVKPRRKLAPRRPVKSNSRWKKEKSGWKRVDTDDEADAAHDESEHDRTADGNPSAPESEPDDESEPPNDGPEISDPKPDPGDEPGTEISVSSPSRPVPTKRDPSDDSGNAREKPGQGRGQGQSLSSGGVAVGQCAGSDALVSSAASPVALDDDDPDDAQGSTRLLMALVAQHQGIAPANDDGLETDGRVADQSELAYGVTWDDVPQDAKDEALAQGMTIDGETQITGWKNPIATLR